METYFAPAPRAEPEEVAAQAASVAEHPFVTAMLEALGAVVLVLNKHRQIIAFNSFVLELLGLDQPQSVLGMRQGEMLRCEHAAQAPSGCGTGKPCRQCGAVLSILACQHTGEPDQRPCLISRGGDDLSFTARSSPVEVGGQRYTVLTLLDSSDQSERRHLERVFLHDLANALAGLQLYSLKWLDEDSDQARAAMKEVEHLVEMIHAERSRLLLDVGTYQPVPTELSLASCLSRVIHTFQTSSLGQRCVIELQVEARPRLRVDETLLLRVLDNMVRNALEATPAGGRVRVRLRALDDRVRVEVHNPGLIPEHVRPRVFTRWFSTKGEGRGLGTWSMRHLTQRYLGGQVGFTSSEGEGTCFWVELPT